MIYLDSAAVIKLIREEDETPELVDYLNDRGGQRLVASALIESRCPGRCAAVNRLSLVP